MVITRPFSDPEVGGTTFLTVSYDTAERSKSLPLCEYEKSYKMNV